jgi:hypothetical protein
LVFWHTNSAIAVPPGLSIDIELQFSTAGTRFAKPGLVQHPEQGHPMNTGFHPAHLTLHPLPSASAMARPAVRAQVPEVPPPNPGIPPVPPEIPPDIDEPEFPDTPVPPVQDPPPQPQPIIG